ncbi:hypothetical protein Tco_1222454, partial [Tanacetum coccineum]
AAGYAKFVSREMSKAESLLKVNTYGALIPEGTPSEFQRILELKYPLNYLRKWALESTKGRQKTRIMGKLNHATCLDTLGALPLATEPPNDGLMNKPPVK